MKKSSKAIGMGWLMFCALAQACVGASVARAQSVQLMPAPLVLSKDSISHRRPRAVEYSDWYARRLLIHRVASYTMLPLFGAEYVLGQKLLNGDGTDAEKNAHVVVAAGLGGLFTVNTVTGLWNLVESRNDPSDRKRRYIHTALMLGADAGFAWAGAIGGEARESSSTRSLHKNIAIGSMGLSTIGAAMMWFWRN